jgi:hypothetical protein
LLRTPGQVDDTVDMFAVAEASANHSKSSAEGVKSSNEIYKVKAQTSSQRKKFTTYIVSVVLSDAYMYNYKTRLLL